MVCVKHTLNTAEAEVRIRPDGKDIEKEIWHRVIKKRDIPAYRYDEEATRELRIEISWSRLIIVNSSIRI